MSIIKLPVSLNPISRRKDRSVKLSYETRELSPEETLTLMSMEGSEGWLLFASQEQEIDLGDVPNEKAEVGSKTASERLRSTLYVWWKQSTEDLSFVGDFDTFYKVKLESIISGVKTKLHD